MFNVQYTREEYEILVPRIIEHMMATKEWGEFFPSTFDPMPYNRSIASRYFPLQKEEALHQGYLWYEEDLQEFPGALDAADLPDVLPIKSDPITIRSSASGKPFRITTQEIDRYRALHAPLPRVSYEERMDARMLQLGGMQLFPRRCAKTGKEILTNYPPDSPYIIWDRDAWEQEFRA